VLDDENWCGVSEHGDISVMYSARDEAEEWVQRMTQTGNLAHVVRVVVHLPLPAEARVEATATAEGVKS
jgi:hypothetical protein